MKHSNISRLAATLGLALVALGPVRAAEKQFSIFLALPDLAFPFFMHMADQAKDEAKKIGGINLIVADGQRSSPKETADIEAAIAKGVNGIMLSPNDVDALTPAIQEAVDANIPVVTVDRRVAKVLGMLAQCPCRQC